MSLRCVIYTRVSTDAQEQKGTSLETQEEECLAHAAAAGWTVVDRFRDSASGFTLDRPGLAQVRHLLRTGALDVLLCHALDRLSRKQTHTGILVQEAEDCGVALEFVLERFEDTATGQFLRNVKSFAAEFEREKIAERTMRGKAQRARSGKLPQATGKGCYGYIYNVATGTREPHPFQAEIVRRIYQRYAETQSFSAVSHELNQAGIPAFSGGPWYPLTVRTVLNNETYSGRTVYRRTKRVVSRNPLTGRTRNRVVAQPEAQWIELPDASPRLIDPVLWERVRAIIDDPERLRRRPEGRTYLLGGRSKCGLCGSAMVGQTLQSKGTPYRYYRCRHAYTNITGQRCAARYVRGSILEEKVWQEVMEALSDPAVVLQELERRSEGADEDGEAERIERGLAELAEREKRLVRLFGFGEVDESVVREQLADVRWQRTALEERLRPLRGAGLSAVGPFDRSKLTAACRAVADWLEHAELADRLLALEALQVAVVATPQQATVSGVLPLETPRFITDEATSRCLCNGDTALHLGRRERAQQPALNRWTAHGR
jgi:site-specific DNA recombinase